MHQNLSQYLERKIKNKNKIDFNNVCYPQIVSYLQNINAESKIYFEKEIRFQFALYTNYNLNYVQGFIIELSNQRKRLQNIISFIIEIGIDSKQYSQLKPKSNQQTIKQLWVIEKKLPQYCIIDTKNLKTYPKVFNRIGFYCWHQYLSNPALIQVSYNNGSSSEWIVAAKIRLEYKQGKQFFKTKQIPTTQMQLLKITMLQNFGDKTTYLNQIQLGFARETNIIQPNRQKTFSDFMKLTSTQKQLKKAQQQIKRLSIQNQQIKQTLKNQSQMIIQMQNAFKIVTKELQKIQKIQQLQTKNYLTDEKQKSKHVQKLLEKKIKSNKLNFVSNQFQSDSQQANRIFIEDKVLNKKTINLLDKKNTSQSYAKSNLNSNKKSRQKLIIENVKNSKGGTVRQSKNQILRRGSDSELSEYLASDQEGNESKYSQKCSQLMVKLQFLIAQRNRREKQLKKRSQRSNS